MSRSQQITAERRRRSSDTLTGRRRKLSVNEAALDRENFVYRWVNDEAGGTRVYDLTTNDDWEVVSDREGKIRPNGTGSEIATHAGTGDTGSPVRAVLLRKPKDWHEADQAEKQRHIDNLEAGMRAGQSPGVGSTEGFYTPKDQPIRIGRGE